MRFQALTAATILFAMGSTACFPDPKVLPARSQPAREMPKLAVEPDPTPADKGRVVIDSVDGPRAVHEVVDSSSAVAYGAGGAGYASAETLRYVCTTPCAADLPRGAHRLRVGGDDFDVPVGSKPSILRVAPGSVKTNLGGLTAGNLFVIVGLSALLSGGALWAVTKASPNEKSSASFETPAAIVSISGLLVTLLGYGITQASRMEITPSSFVHWTPTGGGIQF